jgi:hypothetical protein
MAKDPAIDEVTFDYSIDKSGKTHMLVVHFPDDCDEECFLISLKAYLNAQSENLKRWYGDQKPN